MMERSLVRYEVLKYLRSEGVISAGFTVSTLVKKSSAYVWQYSAIPASYLLAGVSWCLVYLISSLGPAALANFDYVWAGMKAL